MTIEERIAMVMAYRQQGYNCAQAVVAGYMKEVGLDENIAMTCTYGFGAGMGGSGELCGCLTGAGLLLSMKYGKKEADLKHKMFVQQKVGNIIQEYQDTFGEIRCFPLKEMRKHAKDPKYKNCNGYVEDTIRFLEKYILEQKDD